MDMGKFRQALSFTVTLFARCR